MQLPADQTRRLSRGDRTTIRIPVDPRLTVTPLRPAKRGHSKPFRPMIGQRLPVNADDRSMGLLLDVTDFERGPLGDLTLEQANAEGYPTPEEFVQAWVARHDREWFARQYLQLIEADVNDDEAREAQEYAATIRYRDRWAIREVWTLTVRVEHDTTLFLEPARQGRSELGYIMGSDPLDAGAVLREQPDERWARRAARRQLEALAEEESSRDRAVRARQLSRRVRALALQDPRLMREIEQLVRAAEQQAA